MRKQLICTFLTLAVFQSACGKTSDINADTEINSIETHILTKDEFTQSDQVISDTEDIFSSSEIKNIRAMTSPDIKISEFSDEKVILHLNSSLNNVDAVKVYRLTVNSDSGGKVIKELQAELTAGEITDGIIEVPAYDVLSEETYMKDNSNVKCGYSSVGFQVEYANESGNLMSEFCAAETTIDTGTVNQYYAELAGETACGAAAGTLIIQSIDPVWNTALIERMSTIRGYSGISDEYSTGGDKYYMFGWQISNSVNKYLQDNGLSDYSLTDFRTDKSTEETLVELISTGRPAVLEVCYMGGNIITDFEGYSHWITVNGFRMTNEGCEFRCEDTISLKQRWISSEMLDISNANVSYGGEISPTGYICSISKAPINSFV
ncbi:MAG: hypothetical protein Q4E74_01495 [Ruminococcus sp.]|nr:hypothetical protein [Ruminococcus sp.]